MRLEISLDLDDSLTWGQLIEFVDTARSSVVPTDPVTIVTRENERDWIPEALRVELTSAPSRVFVINDEMAAYYRKAIQQIFDEEGDARGQMVELEELRDELS